MTITKRALYEAAALNALIQKGFTIDVAVRIAKEAADKMKMLEDEPMMPTVKFPKGFIALKRHPGYFWHPFEKRLYSLKSGILTPLKVQSGTYHVPGIGRFGPHYQISNRGRRYYIMIHCIEKYLAEGEYTIKRELPG